MGSNRVLSCSVSVPRRFAASASLVVISLCASLTAPAQAESLNADQLKAAYLYNFARYVEWPGEAHASDQSSLKIGVIGSRAVSALLKKTVKGKSVGDRMLEVVDLSAPSDARDSHILFVAGDLSSEELSQALDELSGTSVFVVADDDTFAKKGGTANFFVSDQRVRFAINQGAADKARLKVSSKLLRLAELVD